MTRNNPLLALIVALTLGCQPSAPEPGGAPNPTEAPVTRAERLERAPAAPQTALMAVRMTPKGELSVGHVQPRAIPWTDPLLPHPPKRHEASAEADADGKQPAAPFWDLAIVVEHPEREAPIAVALEVMAPETEHGDVVDPWQQGGALWRVPWLGEGTRYRVIRTSPAPTLELATWGRASR